MNTKHPNGYLPKIAYHIASRNTEKVEYFTNQQIASYGPLSAVDMVTVANEVYRIQRQWEVEEQEFNSHLSVNRF